MKTCTKCGADKPIGDFHVARKSPDGHFHSCKECTLKAQRLRYRENRLAKLASNARWYKDNPGKRREYNAKARNTDRSREYMREYRKRYGREHRAEQTEKHRQYVERNKSQIAAWRREWCAAFPERVAMYNNKRRSGATAASPEQWINLLTDCGWKCVACGRTEGQIERIYPNSRMALEVDHIIPVAIGGDGTVDNLQPLCQPCNSFKRMKAIDYRPRNVREKYGRAESGVL